MTAFLRAGGEPAVRAIVERFVDRMAADFVIGFFFAKADLNRVKLHEYEHAARALGAGTTYTGRPIVAVHRALRINAGQFRRRLALLRAELEAAGVPPDVQELWVAEQLELQEAMTDGLDCTPGES